MLILIIFLVLGFVIGRFSGASESPFGAGRTFPPPDSLSPVALEEARRSTAQVDPLPRETFVLSADRTGTHEIYRINTDGSNPRRLTLDLTFDSWWPRIAADRRRVLFYRTPVGAPAGDFSVTSLWVMNADGSQPRQLRAPGSDGWQLQGHAEWSPDGRQMVMYGGKLGSTQVYITDDEGRTPRQLTHLPGMNSDPSWSPDGSTITFVGCPSPICSEKDWEIYTIPAAGGEPKRLTHNQIRDHDPYFSPDGHQIAWLSETEPNAFKPGYGVWNIFVMNTDGTAQRNLTKDRQINSVPRWAPDGSAIYFHRYEPIGTARWGIYRIHLDGTGLIEITDGSLGNTEYPSL